MAATSAVVHATKRRSAPSMSGGAPPGSPPAAIAAGRQAAYGARPATSASPIRSHGGVRPAARSKSAPSASTGPC